MDNQTVHLAKKHRDYWIGRAQELQSRPEELADEILEFTRQEVKNCSTPDVVGRSEQLVCDRCKENNKEETTDPYCMECKIEIEKQAN
jgi:hypothetical protein